MSIWVRVLRTELLQLARDERALFAAIVLPALLYPLFFWGTAKLEDVGESTMAERTVQVRADLGAVGDGLREAFTEAFLGQGSAEVTDDIDGRELMGIEDDEERRLAARRALRTGEDAADLLVIATSSGDQGLERSTFELWYDVKSDDSREALSRARRALRLVESEETAARRIRLLGADPARALAVETVDVAAPEDAGGAALGRWLPFVALLVLISGGAYAALAVFAGEREAGTLETLLVQPVPHRAVATGKFAAVFLAGLVTLVVNLGSLLACVAFGIGDVEAFSGDLSYARLGWLVLQLPACLLLSAVLCVVCGKARTFREGQLMVFPVTLAAMIPTAIVLRPEAGLTAAWAFVPFAGAALGLKDGLEGDLTLPLGALVMVTHLGWTWLALGRVAGLLDAERVLGGGGASSAEQRLRQAGGRHAVGWGFAVVMAVYLVASWVQRQALVPGLWFTFWLLLPAFALAIAWRMPRDEGEPRALLRTLGLTSPHPLHLLGALLVVPAVAAGASWLLGWQMELLPIPGGEAEGMGLGALGELSGWSLLFFLALSPGINEELVFRGALLSSMKRDWRWPRILAWQALYFGLVHMSIYRLLPTAILGALLAALTLRTRSVVPAILAHASYNALVTFGNPEATALFEGIEGTALERVGELTAQPWWSWTPWLAVLGVGVLIAVRPRATTPAATGSRP